MWQIKINFKHMINKKWVAVAALFIGWSCTKDINLEQKRERKIIANCMLTADSIQTLALTYSNPLKQLYYDEVETASASLYLDNSEVGQFEKKGYSKWQLKHTPKAGGSYQLRVQVPGWKPIEATTSMPQPVQIEKKGGSNDTRRHFTQHSTLLPYWTFIIRQSKDTVMVKPLILPGDKLQNSIGTNHPYRDDFNTTDELSVNNKGTTREHLAYIRINTPSELTDVNKEVDFFLEASLNQSLVVFRSVSAEYDQYMKSSVQKMMVYNTFDDPTQWFDENDIYTNINNGLGIFAAYSDTIIQCHYALDEVSKP
jgi:hypothetical protein